MLIHSLLSHKWFGPSFLQKWFGPAGLKGDSHLHVSNLFCLYPDPNPSHPILCLLLNIFFKNKLWRYPQQRHTLQNPRGTLLEPSLEPPYEPCTLAEPAELLQNSRRILVETSSEPPQTTPQPISTQTPSLSAVGEKQLPHELETLPAQ